METITRTHEIIDSLEIRGRQVGLSRHGLERMLERNISHDEVQAAIARPDKAYMQDDCAVYQRGDYAVVMQRADRYVVTVLYRSAHGDARWASSDGRPSGAVLGAGERARIVALLGQDAYATAA